MKFFKNKLNSLTYLVGNQQKNQIGYGIGTKFGPNYVQRCQKNKETGNIIRFFSYFTSGLQEAVVVKLPEWKFMAIIATNAKF